MALKKFHLPAIALTIGLCLVALNAALNLNRSAGSSTPVPTTTPFPTFTATPSVTNAPAPTPTPTPDHQTYVTRLDDLFLGDGGVIESTTTFSQLRFEAEQNPTLILDQTWRNSVQTAIVGFKARYDEAVALKPPDALKERHLTIIIALTDCHTGMVKYLEATKTLEPQLLTEAIMHLADCKQKFEQLDADRSWRHR